MFYKGKNKILLCWLRCQYRCRDVDAGAPNGPFQWYKEYPKINLPNCCYFYKIPVRLDWRKMVKNRSNHQSCCIRKMFLKTSQNLQESICARDFSPEVFLGVLWSCKKHLFYRKSPDDCFWKYYSKIRYRSICRDLKYLQLIKVVLWK